MPQSLDPETISKIIGKYKNYKSINFDALLLKLGVDESERKKFPIAEIFYEFVHKPETDKWIIKIGAGNVSRSKTIKLNEKFHEVTIDGRDCNCTISPSPKSKFKWNYEQICSDPTKSATVTYEFTGEELHVTDKCGDVVGQMFLKKQKS